MEKYKILKHIYDDIEEAFITSIKLERLFKIEDVYVGHGIHFLRNGKTMVVYELKST